MSFVDYLDRRAIDILSALVPGQPPMELATGVRRRFIRQPDLEIKPDGDDYIFRWHLVPRNAAGGNVYLHLQVADDPERPLHDHPWDNQSVILAGGYRELYVVYPELQWRVQEREVLEGSVVHRRAKEAHRLFLSPESDVPYTISLFTTGPVIRDWGFWFVEDPVRGNWAAHRQWVSHDVAIINGKFIGAPHE